MRQWFWLPAKKALNYEEFLSSLCLVFSHASSAMKLTAERKPLHSLCSVFHLCVCSLKRTLLLLLLIRIEMSARVVSPRPPARCSCFLNLKWKWTLCVTVHWAIKQSRKSAMNEHVLAEHWESHIDKWYLPCGGLWNGHNPLFYISA